MIADKPSVQAMPTTSLLSYLALCSISLITIIPFLQPFHDLPITSFYSEWLAFGLGLIACAPLLTSAFWKNPATPTISVYVLAILGVVAVQLLILKPTYLSQALIPAIYFSWVVLLIVITGWLRTQLGLERMTMVLAWFLLTGGMLHALVSIAQHLDTQQWLSPWIAPKQDHSIIGNVAQRNQLAAHVMLSSVALCYLVTKQCLSARIWPVTLTVLVIALALTGSRAVFLYATAVLALSIYAFRKTNSHTYLKMALVSGVLLSLFTLAQFILTPVNDTLRTILPEPLFNREHGDLETALQRSGMEGIQDRLIEWRKAWLLFLESPGLGIGVGQYAWHSFVLHGQADFTTPRLTVFHHTHNIFMQVLAETGLAGLLLLLLMLGTWLRQFQKNWLTPEGWLIASVLLVLFLYSNLEYPLWYSYFLGIAAVFLALGDNRMWAFTFSPRLAQVGTTASFALAFVILISTYNGYRKLTNINKLVNNSSPEVAADMLQKVAMNPLLTPWAEAAMATHGYPDKNRIREQLALTTRLVRHDPNPVKVYRQTIYLALAGLKNESVALLRHAAVAYTPLFPEYACNLKMLPDKEIRFLAKESERLLGREPECKILKRRLPPLITLHKEPEKR